MGGKCNDFSEPLWLKTKPTGANGEALFFFNRSDKDFSYFLWYIM